MTDSIEEIDETEEMNDYNTIGVWFPSEYRVRCPHCKLFTWLNSPKSLVKCNECGKEFQAIEYTAVQPEDFEYDKNIRMWKK